MPQRILHVCVSFISRSLIKNLNEVYYTSVHCNSTEFEESNSYVINHNSRRQDFPSKMYSGFFKHGNRTLRPNKIFLLEMMDYHRAL